MKRKTRELLNEKVKNRDIFIRKSQEKMEQLKKDNKALAEIIVQIQYLATSNIYGSEKARLDKIKEIVT